MFIRSRSIATLAPLALLLLTASCAKEEPSPKPASDVPPPAASAPNERASASARADAKINVEPKLGGSVLLAGEHPVELAVNADGRVDALVYDATGNPVPPERVSEFSVVLSAESGAKPRIDLAWNVDSQTFRGQADAAVALVAKPIDVSLQVDGKAQTGALDAYTLLPAGDAKLQANADVSADAKLPAPPANARAKLSADAKALADVKAPKLKAPNGAASLQTKANASVAVPKPKADVSAKASAATDKKKSGAGASVKAKASFGFGN